MLIQVLLVSQELLYQITSMACARQGCVTEQATTTPQILHCGHILESEQSYCRGAASTILSRSSSPRPQEIYQSEFILEILGPKAYKLIRAEFWIFLFLQSYRTLYVKPFKIFYSETGRDVNLNFILEILGAKACKLAGAEFFFFFQSYRTL